MAQYQTFAPYIYSAQEHWPSNTRNDDQSAENVGHLSTTLSTAVAWGYLPFGGLASRSVILPFQGNSSSLTTASISLDEISNPRSQSVPQVNTTSVSQVQEGPAPTSQVFAQKDQLSAIQFPSTSAGKNKNSRFLCNVPGCRSKGFLHKRDLTKHNKKHTKEDVYDCPSVGCSRTGDRAHCIRDKFIDHLRRGHKESATTWSCPLESCNGCFQQLEELAEHLRGSHGERRCSQEEKVVSAILKAGST